MSSKRKAEVGTDMLTQYAFSVVDFEVNAKHHLKPKELKKEREQIEKDKREICLDLAEIFNYDTVGVEEIFSSIEDALRDVKMKLIAELCRQQQRRDNKVEDETPRRLTGAAPTRKRPKRAQ